MNHPRHGAAGVGGWGEWIEISGRNPGVVKGRAPLAQAHNPVPVPMKRNEAYEHV